LDGIKPPLPKLQEFFVKHPRVGFLGKLFHSIFAGFSTVRMTDGNAISCGVGKATKEVLLTGKGAQGVGPGGNVCHKK